MVVAIHQPEHFPYLGFFEKMKLCDTFVILDDVQFEKGNFQNRNRFMNRQGVEEWFTVPVDKSANQKLIKDVQTLSLPPNWRQKITTKLKQNFKTDFTDIYSPDNLLEINVRGIKFVREKLKIEVPMVYSSELNIDGRATERLVSICKALKATCYLSGQGGKNYLDEAQFTDNGIELRYMDFHPKDYYTVLSHLEL